MAWTYSGDPSTNDKDAVRVRVGDTDSTDELLQDEEILFFLTERSSNVLLASADSAIAIAGQFSRKVNVKNLSLSVNATDRAKAYLELAKKFREQAGVGPKDAVAAEIFSGGLSIAGKRALKDNSDAVKPSFEIGRDDHPGSDAEDFREDIP